MHFVTASKAWRSRHQKRRLPRSLQSLARTRKGMSPWRSFIWKGQKPLSNFPQKDNEGIATLTSFARNDKLNEMTTILCRPEHILRRASSLIWRGSVSSSNPNPKELNEEILHFVQNDRLNEITNYQGLSRGSSNPSEWPLILSSWTCFRISLLSSSSFQGTLEVSPSSKGQLQKLKIQPCTCNVQKPCQTIETLQQIKTRKIY